MQEVKKDLMKYLKIEIPDDISITSIGNTMETEEVIAGEFQEEKELVIGVIKTEKTIKEKTKHEED